MPYRDPEQKKKGSGEWYQRNRERIIWRYRENREQLNAHKKSLPSGQPEHRRQVWLKYYAAKCEEMSLKKQAAYRDNPEKFKTRILRWRGQNEDRFKTVQKGYRKRHPEQAKHKDKRQRERHYRAPGRHSREQWMARVRYYGWRCVYCKAALTPETLTKDHRIPLAKGGSAWPANLVPACRPCNTKKHTRREGEFRAMAGAA